MAPGERRRSEKAKTRVVLTGVHVVAAGVAKEIWIVGGFPCLDGNELQGRNDVDVVILVLHVEGAKGSGIDAVVGITRCSLGRNDVNDVGTEEGGEPM